jgi:protein TonB
MSASRTSVACIFILASLYGCGSSRPDATARAAATRSDILRAPPYIAISPTLDAYKTAVAQHVVAHNPAHTFFGRLPPMLPAIVVLNITVDRTGQVTRVVVQRSRDPDASKVALASLERSGMLPAPQHLIASNMASLTFSETFLFDDALLRSRLPNLTLRLADATPPSISGQP